MILAQTRSPSLGLLKTKITRRVERRAEDGDVKVAQVRAWDVAMEFH